MSNFIYNKNGIPVAYLLKSGEIYSLDGKALAYLHHDCIYSYAGNVLGFYENGWFIDKNGSYALFTPNSNGGMAKPNNDVCTQEYRLRQREPLKAMRKSPPAKPLLNNQWSLQSDITYFADKKTA